MRILLSNDDGVEAPGLALLERIARRISDDVTIVAPAEEQSGKGRSLTLSEPVRLLRLAERRYAVTGTPTDAVMIALAEVMRDARPDLVLSGINRGANVGEDVFYSGTVGAAMEGALAGIRAIALSQRYDTTSPANLFEAAEAHGEAVLRRLIDAPIPPRGLLNVNFPPVAADAVRGLRVVSQGLRDYGRVRLDRRTAPRGFDYYWLAMGRIPETPQHATDLEAIGDGFISVTPLQLDLTDHGAIAALQQALA